MWMFALALVVVIAYQIVREDLVAGYALVPSEML